MWSKLPSEVLEMIFADLLQALIADLVGGIKDSAYRNKRLVQLMQLQLTCKQWSPVAQRYLYHEIEISQSKHKKRMKLLTQTLLLNTSVREWIRVIDFGYFFLRPIMEGDPTLQELAALAHLCPNITTVTGHHLPPDFFDVVSELRCRGDLQYLGYIDPPECNIERKNDDEMASVLSYNKAIVAFKDTLKNISIIDGAGGNDSTIQPDLLQQFSLIQHLHLGDFSRFHLSRMGKYISNCCPMTTAITIALGNKTVEMSTNNVQPIVTPATQVQHLAIEVYDAFLIPGEMAFIMRMLPSLQSFTFDMVEFQEPDTIVPIKYNIEVVAQFLDYLSLMPKFKYDQMWLGVSQGLGLLPRLANAIDAQDLCIGGVDTDTNALSIQMDRKVQSVKDISNASATVNTKRTSITIQIWSNEAEPSCLKALDAFKNKSISTLSLGIDDYNDLSAFPTITEEFMDYIMDEFPNLQELTFRDAKFPSEAPLDIKNRRKRRLRCLRLYSCKITKDYFTQLFSTLEHVDQFTFSTSMWLERHENEIEDDIRICVPYTSINTLKISFFDLPSYTIRVWSGRTYSEFEVVKKRKVTTNINGTVLTELIDDDRFSSVNVIIHCKNDTGTFTLP
ncbi:hypothetical protein MBANPS3_000540 [Mucor bainieri]